MRSNKRKLTDLGAMLLKTFQFLIDDFDCQLTNQVDEALNSQFEYKNSTTGIVISYEKREQYIRIDLYRLVDGQIVKNITRALKSNEPLNGFSLDYLMKIKDPTKRDIVLPIHKYGEDSEFYFN